MGGWCFYLLVFCSSGCCCWLTWEGGHTGRAPAQKAVARRKAKRKKNRKGQKDPPQSQKILMSFADRQAFYWYRLHLNLGSLAVHTFVSRLTPTQMDHFIGALLGGFLVYVAGGGGVWFWLCLAVNECVRCQELWPTHSSQVTLWADCSNGGQRTARVYSQLEHASDSLGDVGSSLGVWVSSICPSLCYPETHIAQHMQAVPSPILHGGLPRPQMARSDHSPGGWEAGHQTQCSPWGVYQSDLYKPHGLRQHDRLYTSHINENGSR